LRPDGGFTLKPTARTHFVPRVSDSPAARPAEHAERAICAGLSPASPVSSGHMRELPGAYHDFDMFESIRSAAVNQAVEQFTARVSTSPDTSLQDWQPAQDS